MNCNWLFWNWFICYKNWRHHHLAEQKPFHGLLVVHWVHIQVQKCFHLFLSVRDGLFPEKKCILLDLVRMKGGGPCRNFLAHLQEVHFWSTKELLSFKMPITSTLNCSLVYICIHIVQYTVYIVFLVLNWFSNPEKKVVQAVQMGGSGILDKIQKKAFFLGFSRETVPKIKIWFALILDLWCL